MGPGAERPLEAAWLREYFDFCFARKAELIYP